MMNNYDFNKALSDYTEIYRKIRDVYKVPIEDIEALLMCRSKLRYDESQ